MEPYLKDNGGDPLCPLNGKINGLFFGISLVEGEIPDISPYGKKRLRVPIQGLITDDCNLYFADFFCMRGCSTENLYVILVVTKPKSEIDTFCETCLPALDLSKNVFLRKSGSSYEVVARSNLFVDVFYTENVDINALGEEFGKEEVLFSDTDIYRKGHSKYEVGLPKRKSCQTCNPGSKRTCLICQKTCPSQSELRNHVKSEHSEACGVICPWCLDGKSFRTVVELKSHTDQDHKNEDINRKIIKEANAYWLSLKPEQYRKVYQPTPFDSSIAKTARGLVCGLLEDGVQLKKSKEEWLAGWGITSPSEDEDDRFSIKTSTSSDDESRDTSKTSDDEFIDTSKARDDESINEDESVKPKRKPEKRRPEATTSVSPVPPVQRTTKVVPHRIDSTQTTSRISQAPAVRETNSAMPQPPAKKRKNTPTVEAPAKKRKNTPTVEAPAKRSKNTPTVEAPAKRSKNTTTVEAPAKRTKNTTTVEAPAERSKNTPTVEAQEAQSLLERGVMPLLPPARRKWTRREEPLRFGELTIIWPPNGWTDMPPDVRLLHWEFAAMTLESRLQRSRSPLISRDELLAKYNFLALPGTGESRSENDVVTKTRFYNSKLLHNISLGERPSDIGTILAMFKAASEFRGHDLDDLFDQVKDVPLRLTTSE